jgi:hypothetical protein
MLVCFANFAAFLCVLGGKAFDLARISKILNRKGPKELLKRSAAKRLPEFRAPQTML